MTHTIAAYAAPSPKAPLEPTTVPRRELGEHDILIDIKFAAGACGRLGWPRPDGNGRMHQTGKTERGQEDDQGQAEMLPFAAAVQAVPHRGVAGGAEGREGR